MWVLAPLGLCAVVWRGSLVVALGALGSIALGAVEAMVMTLRAKGNITLNLGMCSDIYEDLLGSVGLAL